MGNKKSNVPVWFVAVIVATMLPAVALPFLWVYLPLPQDEGLVSMRSLFPLFGLLAGILAYKSYETRPEVAWILIVMVWLTAGAFAVR